MSAARGLGASDRRAAPASAGGQPARESWLGGHRRAFTEAVNELVASPASTSAMVLVVAVILALPFAGWQLYAGYGALLASSGAQAEVTVMLELDVDAAEAETLRQRLLAGPDTPAFVGQSRVVDRDAALAEYQSLSGVDIDTTAFEGGNPLPFVLIATLEGGTAESVASWARAVASEPRVALVQSDSEWLAQIAALGRTGARLALAAALGLAFGVLLVVGLGTRAWLEQRAAVVEVAKLCGASDAFVRRPFVYGGALLGGVGGVLALALVALAGLLLAEPLGFVRSILESEQSLSRNSLLQDLLPPAFGAGLGAFGALLAVNGRIRAIEPR